MRATSRRLAATHHGAWSVLTLFGMVIALVASFATAAPAAAGDEETGTSTGGALWEANILSINVYGCPGPVDQSSIALGNLFADCVEDAGFVSFTLYNGWYGTKYFSTPGGMPNHVEYIGLDFQDAYDAPDAGTGYPVPLEISYPAGYESSIVFCSNFDTSSGEMVYGPTYFNVAGNTTIEVAADAGHTIHCDWFLVPPLTLEINDDALIEVPGIDTDDEEVATGTVTISKYTCPQGYSPTDDEYQMSEQCQEEVDPVSFTVSADGYSETHVADPGVPQNASFFDVPFGTVAISEAVPDGFGEPLVFCTDTPSDGAGNYEPVTVVEGSQIVVDLRAEAEIPLACIFFNFQDGQPEGDTETQGGNVHLSKYTCPAGYEPADDDYIMSEQCQEDVAPVTFTISGPDGYAESLTTTGGVPQGVDFANVPFGTITISEDVPAGYGTPQFHCTDTPSDGAGNYELVPDLGDGSIEIEHRADAEIDLACVVFNFQQGNEDDGQQVDPGNTVTVDKYVCPPGANIEEDILLDICAPGGDGIAFEFVDGNGIHPATVAGGIVEWSGVVIGAEGELQIIEEIPEGYGDPLVVCDGLRMASTNGFVVPDPGGASPFHIQCDWFNLQHDDGGEGGDVRVHKYTCPIGYEPLDDFYLMSEQCTADADPVTFAIDGPDSYFQQQDAVAGSGAGLEATFTNVPFGAIEISEDIPAGFGEPRAFCSDTEADGPGAYEPATMLDADTFTWDHRADATIALTCLVFNFQDDGGEDEGEGRDVHITKYTCPEEIERTDDWYALGESCFEEIDPVDFTITVPTTDYAETVTASPGAPQEATFTNVPFGTLYLEETVPDGFNHPLVFCSDTPADGAGNYTEVEPWPESGAFIWEHRADAEIDLRCIVFNFHQVDPDYSALEVIKHTCPAGYDFEAADADPYVDCPELTNGIDFTLSGPGVEMDSTTGNAGDGAIFFGGLPPGDYTVTESIPDGIDSTFVTDCQGLLTDAVHPYPLATGDTLTITLVGGELVTCHWFNVPEQEGGQLTVIKYTCSTPEYESDVDCEIFEDGQGFDLLDWNGSAYVFLDSGTTDGAGRLTWTDLEEGSYLLDEHDREWCHVEPSIVPEEDLNGFMVIAGEEQVVKVYNCDGEPGRPGKTPTKYPDTGVAPTTQGESTLPAIAATGLLGIALSRRRLAALTLTATAAVIGGNRVLAAQDQVIEQAEATPSDIPDSLCLPAEEGDDSDTCRRGPVPVNLQIAAITVEAPIEVLETVGGVMQQPSDESHVAWYKETARLGETGNLLLAGHLNWWGIPEAVFFRLGELRAGDAVVLLDETDTSFAYTVEWVRQESNLEPPAEDVLGMTGYEAVTLITCSGEWNSGLSEYDSRTVVRARRDPAEGTPET